MFEFDTFLKCLMSNMNEFKQRVYYEQKSPVKRGICLYSGDLI